MSDDALVRHPKGHHDGPEKSSPYPVARLAPAFDIVDAARQIKAADSILSVAVGAQLGIIADQIRSLQDKAREVIAEAQRSAELHRAGCSFQKRPGAIYHLYRRTDGAAYFSLLSPEEWGAACPHAFEGSYRLEADMSFRQLDP